MSPTKPPKPSKPAQIAQKAKWARLAKKPSKQLARAAKALYAPALALAVVLACSASAEPTDYVLLLPSGEAVCAKDRDSCQAAQQAIRTGWLTWAERNAPTRCEPKPGCFSKRSNCIPGYNCR